MVPKGGLDPPRVTSHAPQTCASTSSATSARSGGLSINESKGVTLAYDQIVSTPADLLSPDFCKRTPICLSMARAKALGPSRSARQPALAPVLESRSALRPAVPARQTATPNSCL